MRAIATIDRQPANDEIVVWVTSRVEGLRALNTNAVRSDAAEDLLAMDKVRWLTQDCVVLLTEGSTLDGLPVEGLCLTLDDVEGLVSETEVRQRAIVSSVRDYKRRTNSGSLKEPTFTASPHASDFPPPDTTAVQRTLAAANFVSRAWTVWLETEEERRRRTVSPRTGVSPWMMPDELNSPHIAPLPPLLSARLQQHG